jgi:hypothetical protein
MKYIEKFESCEQFCQLSVVYISRSVLFVPFIFPCLTNILIFISVFLRPYTMNI